MIENKYVDASSVPGQYDHIILGWVPQVIDVVCELAELNAYRCPVGRPSNCHLLVFGDWQRAQPLSKDFRFRIGDIEDHIGCSEKLVHAAETTDLPQQPVELSLIVHCTESL